MEMASLYEEKRDARGAVLARRSVAELLVAQGLATVTRHKAGDPRAARYDALLAAEEQARAAKRGLHSGQEEAALKPVQDLSRDVGRARARGVDEGEAGGVHAAGEVGERVGAPERVCVCERERERGGQRTHPMENQL